MWIWHASGAQPCPSLVKCWWEDTATTCLRLPETSERTFLLRERAQIEAAGRATSEWEGTDSGHDLKNASPPAMHT